MSCFLP